MKVHWTKAAEAHLDAIYAYIAQDSRTYALRIVDRITSRSQQDVIAVIHGAMNVLENKHE